MGISSLNGPGHGWRRTISVKDENYTDRPWRVRYLWPTGRMVDDADLPYGAIRYRRLWAGGVATAAVTALTAGISVFFVRNILDIPVFPSGQHAVPGDLTAGSLALWSALASLAATGLMIGLIKAVPRPLLYFGWIIALVTVLVALTPFSGDAQRSVQVASAVIYAVIGLEIGILVVEATRSSILPVVRAEVVPAPEDGRL